MLPAQSRTADSGLRSALALAAIFFITKLVLQFALTLWTEHLGYSYFNDEFYYIACGHHLAWGFVDHGPIVALQARISEMFFGDSIFAIRIFSAVAGALTIFLGGVLCWSLGGRRPAQALTCIGLIVTPQYIGVDSFLSMNSFEAVFWSVCLLAIIMIARGASEALWWTVFGMSAGFGILNKPSMIFFLIAIGIGLMLTPHRRLLGSGWASFAVGLFLLIPLPNLLWQVHNHWPTAEFLYNGRILGKNVVLNPFQFLLMQIEKMHPLNVFLWVTGVVALCRGRLIRSARWLGLTFIAFFVIMCAAHAKDYYLEGIYPAFFAAGAIAWEHRFSPLHDVRPDRLFAFPTYETLLVLTGLVLLPLSSPVLRPSTWVRYTTALHLPSTPTDTNEIGPLPEFFADRFGWEEQYDVVSKAFHSLSVVDQQRVCIFGKDYGEAANIDFRNRLHGDTLPAAVSGQNSYWTWGLHGCDPNLIIGMVPGTPENVEHLYRSVTVLGRNRDPYSMASERQNIYLLRGRKPSASFNWMKERFYY